MRLIALSLLVFNSILSRGQQNNAQGHWFFCHPEDGYAEIYIQDSVLFLASLTAGDFMMRPVPLDFKPVATLPKPASDTFYYQTIDNNLLVTNWFGSEILMTRMPDNVLNIGDYDCSLKLSMRAYQELLIAEFSARYIKNKRQCAPYMSFTNRMDSIPSIDNLLIENDLEPPKLQKPTAVIAFIEPQIINEGAREGVLPKLIEITWNSDSSEVIVCIELTENCYADFLEHRCFINEQGHLKLNYRKLDSKCEDRCLMRIYFHLFISNSPRLMQIILNDVDVEN
jgi:hypothetical protein